MHLTATSLSCQRPRQVSPARSQQVIKLFTASSLVCYSKPTNGAELWLPDGMAAAHGQGKPQQPVWGQMRQIEQPKIKAAHQMCRSRGVPRTARLRWE